MFMALFQYQQGNRSKEIVNYLNSVATDVYNNRYIYCMEQCKTKASAQMFHDWWNGVCVSADEYRSRISEDDYHDAHMWIMETISLGMG